MDANCLQPLAMARYQIRVVGGGQSSSMLHRRLTGSNGIGQPKHLSKAVMENPGFDGLAAQGTIQNTISKAHLILIFCSRDT